MDERRVITVLFCDVAGSTALASQLDPEEWAEIIGAAFPCLIEPVERYGGTVARLMGDAILAFFGAPIAHEDDAQRAVLAGLGILEGIQSLRAEVERDYGLDFNVRVGINTGTVVVGAFGTESTFEYTAMGDAVNVAARMEQTATPGTVQIAADTYALVYPYFTCEPLGPIGVKGKDEPADVYRVTGRALAPSRSRGDFWAPVIGRERELCELTDAWSDTLAGKGRVCALIGEAGLGKSRLLGELRHSAGVASESLMEDRLVSFEAAAPYGLIRGRICAGLGLADGATTEDIRSAITAQLTTLDANERERAVRTVDLLFAAGSERSNNVSARASTPIDAVEFRHELVEIVELLWRRWVSECGAGVYVVDDVHYADVASVQILETLLARVAELPVLVVLAFRPEEHSAAWLLHRNLTEHLGDRYCAIRLSPLDERQIGGLVDALLTGARLPAELRAAILDRADGNPLFAEEIVRSLIGQGLVIKQPNVDGMLLRLADGADLERFIVPTTLQSLMQERIDRLSPAEKQTLQLAAVLGRTFTHEELAVAVDDPERLESHLDALQRAMLVSAHSSGTDRAYGFSHALTREAAYQIILNRQRRRLHARVGDALERLHAGHAEDYAGLLAHHFAEARDARAITYASMAGERSLLLFAPAEAVEHYSHAVDVALQLKQEPPLTVYQGRGRAFLHQGRYEQARPDFEAALELARDSGDLETEWSLLLDLGESWAGSDYAQAGEWYAAALQRAQTLGDDLLVARTLGRLGNWHTNADRVEDARVALQEALDIFQRRDDRRGLAETLDLLGILEDIAGNTAHMLSYFRQAAALFEELDERRLLSSALANIAQTAGIQVLHAVIAAGDITEAESFEAAERAIQISRSIGDRPGEAYASLVQGAMHEMRGQYALAIQRTEAGFAIAQEVGHNEWLALGHLARGWLRSALLETDNGLDEFELALQYARAVGSAHFTNIALASIVLAAIEAGDLERAAMMLRQVPPTFSEHTVSTRLVEMSRAAFEVARGDAQTALQINDRLFTTTAKVEDISDIPRLAWQRGEALRALGRVDEARDALEAALRGATSRGFRTYLWRLYSALGHVQLLHGDTVRAEQAFMQARAEVNKLSESISSLPQREGFVGRAEAVISDAQRSAHDEAS